MTNGLGNSEDNVWLVESQITDRDKQAVHLLGAGEGWRGKGTGTALIAGPNIPASDRMIQLEGGFLSTITKMRFDGAGNGGGGIRIQSDNDYQLHRVMVHDQGSASFGLAGGQNIWVDSCWSEQNSGAGVNAQAANDLWLTNHLSWSTQRGLQVREMDRVWAKNVRLTAEGRAGIRLSGGLGFKRVRIEDAMIQDASDSNSNTYDSLEILDAVTDLQIRGCSFDGGTQARYGINIDTGAGGGITEGVVQNTRILNHATGKYNSVFDGGNTTRAVVEGRFADPPTLSLAGVNGTAAPTDFPPANPTTSALTGAARPRIFRASTQSIESASGLWSSTRAART